MAVPETEAKPPLTPGEKTSVPVAPVAEGKAVGAPPPPGDATKYVGTPAVGTSKAAAAGGLATVGPDDTEISRRRRRLVWSCVAAFLGAWFLAFFRFFFPRTLFEPKASSRSAIRPISVSASTPNFSSNTASGWSATPEGMFVISALCTHLGCTPDWKPSENKFKCPCHGSGYDPEGVNFEGPAPRPMDRAHVELAPEGQIVVDLSQLYSLAQGGAAASSRTRGIYTGLVGSTGPSNSPAAHEVGNCLRK